MDLGKSGFATLAMLIAVLYGSVRLLPPSHPYLNAKNHGRFTVTDVIVAAANNLRFTSAHIDQIIIFGAILLGLILLIFQALFFIASLLFESAWAQSGFLVTPNPRDDIAYTILDQVFGVPGVFGSKFDPAQTALGVPPFHRALQNMFSLYSAVMLLIGVIIFAYYILVVAYETAQTGKPFGQRFNTVWAPIRLVVALGLLVPVSFGLNSAQYIVLYTAKYGSGLATNAWLTFYHTLVIETGEETAVPFGYKTSSRQTISLYEDRITTNGVASEALEVNDNQAEYRRSLIALPKRPDAALLAQSYVLINSCFHLYAQMRSDPAIDNLEPYLVSNKKDPNGDGRLYEPLLAYQYDDEAIPALYELAKDFYDNGDIVVRFGEHSVEKYPDEAGNVKSLCGEITIPVTSIAHLRKDQTSGDLSPAQIFQRSLLHNIIIFAASDPFLDNDFEEAPAAFGRYWAERSLKETDQNDGEKTPVQACENIEQNSYNAFQIPVKVNNKISCDEEPLPDSRFFHIIRETTNADLATDYGHLYASALGLKFKQADYPGLDISLEQHIRDLGWGGAALWYNKVAEINGMLTTAANQIPKMTRLPDVMEEVLEKKKKAEAKLIAKNLYEPVITNKSVKEPAFPDDPYKQTIASSLYDVQILANKHLGARPEEKKTGNFLVRVLDSLLGIGGIYTIRENIQVHPLAQLTSLGRSLIDSSIRNLGISAGLGLAGGIINELFSEDFGGSLNLFSSVFSSFAAISMTMGVVLYYIVPFMPFLFFFVTMLAWVKTIFEAMVGVPLWALAHLQIEGDGFITDWAKGGYYLILDIFLRPILIVAGLLGATIVFFMEVYVLHIIYDLAIDNVAGADPECTGLLGGGHNSDSCRNSGGFIATARHGFDGFFYTVLYTIIVYIMANSTFKLIMLVPKDIYRWAGSDASPLGDNAEDPFENLQRNAGIAAGAIARQAAGAAPSAFSTLGTGTGKLLGPGGLNLFKGKE